MANDSNVHQVSPAVSLFQKAHGRMTTMQRIDEQVAALLDQRRKIQEELRSIPPLINEEFDRVTRQSAAAPSRVLSRIAEAAGGNGMHDPVMPRVEVGEVVS